MQPNHAFLPTRSKSFSSCSGFFVASWLLYIFLLRTMSCSTVCYYFHNQIDCTIVCTLWLLLFFYSVIDLFQSVGYCITLQICWHTIAWIEPSLILLLLHAIYQFYSINFCSLPIGNEQSANQTSSYRIRDSCNLIWFIENWHLYCSVSIYSFHHPWMRYS